ncbi:aminotransferase class V-fold PLP-dependent enzyme [Catenovulum adriaticum]|uniref:Probable cysteine desulfurase n=1 Tax=Catenovulum adriaticum TaxID=2984846 RepID=A0ABY7AHB3_9ALTE|nr:cysteine desulfurase [Catenovulum sp. TS8]WAJ69005.1 cysteine desulfurase [Catenovulum sp. TS8]
MKTPDYIVHFRENFPFFDEVDKTRPINQAYLDNAATTHICQSALSAINHYYQYQHANVHRSSHQLALGTSHQFENIRKQCAQWLNANSEKEIIWTKGATEAANLIAHCLAQSHLKAGDEIIISLTEHHANFVTWQQIAKQHGLILKIAKLDANLQINFDVLDELVNEKTKVVALCHVANATGVTQPIEPILKKLKKADIFTIIDGSQAVNHININLQALNCDCYFFSAHKMFAGTGLGVCYVKESWLEQLHPYQFGGEMVKRVKQDTTEFNQLPYKFEAGTPNIAGVFAFGQTLSFIQNEMTDDIRAYETQLLDYLLSQLQQRHNIKILATQHLQGAVSFIITDWHSADAAEILSQLGVALRAGSHCAMPLMDSISPKGSLRVSIAAYTLVEEIDYFLACLDQLSDFIE